jgi:hypothetical protein
VGVTNGEGTSGIEAQPQEITERKNGRKKGTKALDDEVEKARSSENR